MGDLVAVAGIAGGVGCLVAGLVSAAIYFIDRGRNEGGAKTSITNLDSAVKQANERAESAHARADALDKDMHSFREMVARDYVTYERMREFKTELMTAIQSQSGAMSAIHQRLDSIIRSIAAAGRSKQSVDGD